MLLLTNFETAERMPLFGSLPAPTTLVSSTGSSRIELAKMIGTTPAWLTFSGM